MKNNAASNYFSAPYDDSVFNSIANLVIAVDHRGRITIFNHVCERLFDLGADQAIGRPISEIIPFPGLIKVLKPGKAHIGRKFVLGNSLYIVNRTPIKRNNLVVGAIGVAQEITELHQIATELEETTRQKQILESIFKHTGEGYISINGQGCITMLNPAMAKLMNVSATDVLDRHVTEVMPDIQMNMTHINGSSQHNELLQWGDKKMLVSRYPVIMNGKVEGAVNKFVFQGLDKLASAAHQHFRRQKDGDVKGARYKLSEIIGASKSISRLKDLTRRVARGPSTVLITGESGTGKELFAHAIHAHSPRRDGPFVKVNCPAVPENLLESELFGYREGAFTGARKGGQIGKFELADNGTIFLDEIGDMPLSMQAKLLRVLQEKEIERLGDRCTKRINVRVVAATNRNLTELLNEGKFRNDLYFRLNVVNINIPPLRDRREDVLKLANHFINRFNREFNLKVKQLDSDVAGFFEVYNWPGNVREVENVIERAFNLVENDRIELKHLPQYLVKQKGSHKQSGGDKSLPALLENVEKEALLEALEETGGNKLRAARLLGISRAWLYKKIKQYQIEL
ncbi:MAG: sigma 54-interacting transcriptional regulator [Firmicutes bacterium]|nr:sigma 54-interacting transcriptional regulator [Bacillota bacterium]